MIWQFIGRMEIFLKLSQLNAQNGWFYYYNKALLILSQLTIKIAPWHVLLSRLVYLKIILDRGTGRSKISLGIISPPPAVV